MTDPVRLDRSRQSDSPTPESLMTEMIEAGSDEMDFHVHRTPEPGRTFSREAMDDVTTAIEVFVGARIAARFRDLPEGDPGPSDMHVNVKITLDGKTFDVPVEVRPWYAIDGSHRQRGAQA